MKRLIVAVILLVLSVSLSFFGNKYLLTNLESIKDETLSVLKRDSDVSDLIESWNEKERLFSVFLNDSKLKKIKEYIFELKTIDIDGFEISCNRIIYEIDEISRSQKFFIENIL